MIGIEPRGGDPGTELACDGGHVEDVVEMPVGDDNTPNWIVVPTAFAKGPAQDGATADKAGIEQIQPGRVFQDVEINDRRSDLENIGIQAELMGGSQGSCCRRCVCACGLEFGCFLFGTRTSVIIDVGFILGQFP